MFISSLAAITNTENIYLIAFYTFAFEYCSFYGM